VLLLLLVCSSSGLGCLDANGQATDFFIALKQPEGYDYQIFDKDQFKAAGSLNSGTGPIGNTLSSVYNCNGCAYVLYNDETPSNEVHESNAHMKGVIGFDKSGGFWLVHSVPRFPPNINSGYNYPQDETKYGQSFLCISLDHPWFDSIGQFFQIDYPYVYDSTIPSNLVNLVPNLQEYLNGKHLTKPFSNVSSVVSRGGKKFEVFAKNKEWEKELYEDLVAPYYSTGMMTETWQDGPGKLPSYCKPNYSYNVENIDRVCMSNGACWKSSDDHSKWGLTKQQNITCVGDINRVKGQFKRGGGTVCFTGGAWTAFTSVIQSVDTC